MAKDGDKCRRRVSNCEYLQPNKANTELTTFLLLIRKIDEESIHNEGYSTSSNDSFMYIATEKLFAYRAVSNSFLSM